MTWRPDWLHRLAPPGSLGDKIRWLFLIFVLFNLAVTVPRTLNGTAAPLSWRLGAVAGAVALGCWWLRGYRQKSFPAWAVPIEGAVLGVIGYGTHNWVITLGLLFVTVSFRGLFGTWKHVLGLTVSLFAGSLGAVLLTDPAHTGAFLQQVAGVPPLALFTAAVAEMTRRQEQAAARERVFARLGSTLVTTSDRETICRHAVEAAEGLLGGLPGGWAAVALNSPDGEVVSTGAGEVPVGLLGSAYDGRPEGLDGSGSSTADLVRVQIALQGEKYRYGTLLVGGTAPVPADVRPSLETIAAQTVLGLVNAEHAADLRRQAFHDSLTGLANRSLLRERLTHALFRARRGSPVAVLLIDLDGFKAINDTYGHAAGDHVLVAVGQRLRDGVRGADTAARLGGDEFAVLLDGMDAPQDAILVAERLLLSIQAPLNVGGVELMPGGSIGVAVWHGHADIDAFLHEADTAMYTAKTAGKGRIGHLAESGTIQTRTPLPAAAVAEE